MQPRYIGIDAHASSCTIAVMGTSGRRLREQRVETHGHALREMIGAIRGRKHVCLEEGELSEWLYEILEPLVDEVVVVQPGRSRGNKSDALDAWTRADELRRGVADRIVYKSPSTLVELRQAVRAYQATRRDMVRAKLRLRSLCRSRGVPIIVKRRVERESVQDALAQLPPPQRRLAELILAQVEVLQAVHDQAAEWLHEQGRRVPAVRRIGTAPGLGPVRAAFVAAAVITPWRFRTKRQFWAYCGLAVVTRSSSDWVREHGKWVRKNVPQTRGLNTNRKPVLKDVFVGAADHVISHSPSHPLHKDYQRLLEQGTKPTLARLTIARRIAAAVLAMWKHQEDYDSTKHCNTAA